MVGGAIPGLVVLGSRRKQAEQAMESKAFLSVSLSLSLSLSPLSPPPFYFPGKATCRKRAFGHSPLTCGSSPLPAIPFPPSPQYVLQVSNTERNRNLSQKNFP